MDIMLCLRHEVFLKRFPLQNLNLEQQTLNPLGSSPITTRSPPSMTHVTTYKISISRLIANTNYSRFISWWTKPITAKPKIERPIIWSPDPPMNGQDYLRGQSHVASHVCITIISTTQHTQTKHVLCAVSCTTYKSLLTTRQWKNRKDCRCEVNEDLNQYSEKKKKISILLLY